MFKLKTKQAGKLSVVYGLALMMVALVALALGNENTGQITSLFSIGIVWTIIGFVLVQKST